MFTRDEILSSSPLERQSAVDSEKVLRIDLAQAQRFLDFLGGEDSRFFFLTMNDEKGKKEEVRNLTRPFPEATLEEVAGKLVGLNRKGAGVFVAVNEIIGMKRVLNAVGEIRAVIRELDQESDKELPIRQSLRVCSSPGKYHDYWLLDFEDQAVQNMTGLDFTAIQRRLVKDWGSDRGVIDATRVLRLPGFYHQKRGKNGSGFEPHRVEFEVYDGGAIYTYAEVVAAFPPVAVSKEPIPPSSKEFDASKLRPFFEALDSNLDYHDWLRTGMIIHWASKGSREGLALWDSLSSEWRAYAAGVCEAKWATFQDDPGGGTATLDTLKGMLADQGAEAAAGRLAAFLAAEEFDDGFVYDPEPESRGRPRWGIQKHLDDDPAIEYLERLELIESGNREGKIPIRCPWADQHEKGESAMAWFSPMFRGKFPDRRGFGCKAGSCNHSSQEFFDKMFADHEGTEEPFRADGRLEFSQKRYALIETGQLVVDLWQKPKEEAQTEGMKLGDWKAARSYQAHVGYKEEEEGGLKPVYQVLGSTWQNAQNTHRLLGVSYRPDLPKKRIFKDNGELYYNRYIPPYQERVLGEPTEFLAHCNHVIPSESERKVFLDWLAYKIQHPDRRAYAVVMVADTSIHSVPPPKGKKLARFGVGRSLLGDMISSILQQGVRRLDLEEFINRDGQAAYNEWASHSQLVVIEEAHGDAPRHGNEGARTEAHMRTLIDSRPVSNTRVKVKYGAIETQTVYYNVLIFTNHSDALRIPEQDRRFFVLRNANWQRRPEEYAAFAKAIRDPTQVGQVYTWLRARDVSEFDPNHPPITEAKKEMTRSSVRLIDEDTNMLLAMLPGDLVTKRQLTEAAARVIQEELYDPDGKSAKALLSRVTWVWRKGAHHLVDTTSLGNHRGARTWLADKEKRGPEVVRALRNVKKWAQVWEKEGPRGCLAELRKNDLKPQDFDAESEA